MSPGEQICCFMEQEKRASKSEGAVRVRSWEQAGEHISHDAALYLPPKWHLYLPKLSFDSLPHTELQITFNTDIKSSSKVCPKRWKAALLCGTYCRCHHSLCLCGSELQKKISPKPLLCVQNILCHLSSFKFLSILQLCTQSNFSYLPVTLWMRKDTPKGDLIYSCD